MDAAVVSRVDEVLARLEADLNELASLSFDSSTDEEVLEVWRRMERHRRRQASVDHGVIAQVETRSLAFHHGCKNTIALARQVLRISPGEASARVKAAAALGPRRTLCGEPLEPVYPTVAAAQAAGDISARHAQTIVRTIEKLPDEVRAVVDRTVETLLVDFAREHDPDTLGKHARDVAFLLDQDGHYHELAYRERRRGLTLHRRVDGSGWVEGELTAECAEHLETHLDALARPEPAADGVKDPRTAAQRRHDGLLAMLKLVERAELLPTIAGVSATIIVTMDAESYATGTGTARTGHGYSIPADVAKRWAGPEARIIAVLLSKTKAITAYSSSQRIFTEQQRLALIARDGGCSFPRVRRPTTMVRSEPCTEYQQSRRTCVDDGALMCSHDHRNFEAMGWKCVMTDGRPHWIPPRFLDATQTPRRNTTHDHAEPGYAATRAANPGIGPAGLSGDLRRP